MTTRDTITIVRPKTVTIVEEETRVIPSYYYEDKSAQGIVVDEILLLQGSKRNRYNVREDLYDEDIVVIDSALEKLTVAYTLAERILETLKRNGWRSD